MSGSERSKSVQWEDCVDARRATVNSEDSGSARASAASLSDSQTSSGRRSHTAAPQRCRSVCPPPSGGFVLSVRRRYLSDSEICTEENVDDSYSDICGHTHRHASLDCLVDNATSDTKSDFDNCVGDVVDGMENPFDTLDDDALPKRRTQTVAGDIEDEAVEPLAMATARYRRKSLPATRLSPRRQPPIRPALTLPSKKRSKSSSSQPPVKECYDDVAAFYDSFMHPRYQLDQEKLPPEFRTAFETPHNGQRSTSDGSIEQVGEQLARRTQQFYESSDNRRWLEGMFRRLDAHEKPTPAAYAQLVHEVAERMLLSGSDVAMALVLFEFAYQLALRALQAGLSADFVPLLRAVVVYSVVRNWSLQLPRVANWTPLLHVTRCSAPHPSTLDADRRLTRTNHTAADHSADRWSITNAQLGLAMVTFGVLVLALCAFQWKRPRP